MSRVLHLLTILLTSMLSFSEQVRADDLPYPEIPAEYRTVSIDGVDKVYGVEVAGKKGFKALVGDKTTIELRMGKKPLHLEVIGLKKGESGLVIFDQNGKPVRRIIYTVTDPIEEVVKKTAARVLKERAEKANQGKENQKKEPVK